MRDFPAGSLEKHSPSDAESIPWPSRPSAAVSTRSSLTRPSLSSSDWRVDEPIRTLERDPQASSKGMGRGGEADGAGLALKVVNYSMNERPPSGQVLGYRTQRGASLFDSADDVLMVRRFVGPICRR